MSAARIALLVADAAVALTAIGGGIALATGLEGDRFSLDMLKGTPFRNYVLPGILLAAAVGGSAAVAAALTILEPRAGTLASAVAGVIMIGWIVGEVFLLDQPSAPHWTEVLYFAVGLAMVLLALRLRWA
jgi:hypothetical protein